jgi:hypothetical protein
MKDATTDPTTVTAMWTTFPTANIGLHCKRSGIVTMDIDPRNGGDQTLQALVGLHGEDFMHTAAANTGGGGLHFLFRDTGGTWKGELGRGIDVKSNGYIIVAPSLHKSGKPYAWRPGHSPFEVALRAPDQWIVDELQTPPSAKRTTGGGAQPEPSLASIRAGCAFVEHVASDAATLSEPDWHAGMSIVARTKDGRTAVHRTSAPYPKYSADETDREYEKVMADTGPWKCATIQRQLGFRGCASCSHFGQITSPIQLGSSIPASADGKPTIVVTGREMPSITADAFEAIKAANDPVRIGQMGDNLIRLIESDDRLRVEPLGVAELRHELDRVAHWRQRNQGGSITPLKQIATAIVEDMLANPRPPVPTIKSVVGAPFFAPGGRLVNTKGYDSASGVYLHLPVELSDLEIPRSPSKAEVAAARHAVLEIIADFPFVAESDRINAFAKILDPFARPLFDGITPLYLITAPTAGTGKSLLVDALTLLATGEVCPRTPLAKQDDAALSKLVMSLLRKGVTDVNFDNVQGRLYSSVLSLILTASQHSDRLLGGNDIATYSQRVNWSVTGNNLEVDADIGRRVVPVRIMASAARPEERTEFLHADLIGWEKTNRRELVAACLTLIQAWVADGMQPGPVTLGSYESWSRTLSGILACIGLPGLLDNRREFLKERDADANSWGPVVELWHMTYGESPVKTAQVLALMDDLDFPPVPLKGDSARSDCQLLAWALKKNTNGHFAGFLLTALEPDRHDKTARWALRKD